MGDIGRITFWRARAALSAAAALLAGAVLLTVAQSIPETSFPAHGAAQSGADAERAYADLPLSFEPNEGRMGPSVDFLARTSAGTAYLTDSGARLALPGRDGGAAVELRLLDAGRSEPEALRRLPGSVNDLRGDDPSKWETGIPTFERVRYSGIYPGVDLEWHGSRRALEYDFRLAAGAQVKRIGLRVEGAEQLRLAGDGDLLIEIGGRTLRQAAPVAYQPSGAARTPVSARFELRGETVRFRLGEYDRDRPLVIDPVVLDYSTYLGGNGADAANAIAADGFGAAYVTGRTLSTDFDLLGPVEGNDTDADVFVSKLNPAGDALLYSTYLGGNGSDSGNGIAVDAVGAAYLVGTTESTDLSALTFDANGQATVINPLLADGPKADAFVAKLTPAGDALVYSAYLGSSGAGREDDQAAADEGTAIAVNAAGAAYVTGSTDGTNFPIVNAIEGNTAELDPSASSPGGGLPGPELSDAFVSKVNPAGDQLEYSTYLGGDQGDGGTGIAVDSLGAAYVTGGTSSPDFNTFDPIEGDSPGYDAFVSKLSSTGTALEYSTYLGGDDYDAAYGIALDATGAAYVTGATKSTDFNTLSPVEGNSPGPDAFVSKLTPTGDALSYSTYLGGARADWANGVAVDSAGSAFVTGQTDSRDFDLAGELEGDSAGTDAFVSKLGPAGSLACSTYLGGGGDDRSNAIALAGPSGQVLIAGETSSADFDREGGLEGDSTGEDAFVSELTLGSPCPDGPEGPPGPAPAQGLRVYVMVLDGLRPTEIDPNLTPNLEELKQGGTWYEQARSVFIAETLPNHAAMMTGVLPERNGIVGNDALLVRRVDPQNASKYRMHDPRLLDAETLTTRLEESCDVSTATVQSKLYLYNLFTGEPPSPSDPADQRIADYHWAPFSSPLFIPEPDDHVPDQGTMNEGFLPWLRTNPPPPDPQFAFVNLGDIDRSGHVDQFAASAPGGLSASRQAGLADTDTLIGDFVDELKATGAWDETVLIFASDHGFDWGTQDKDMNVTGVSFAGRQDVIPNGAGAMVYVRDGTDLGPPAQQIAALPGVELVATREPVAGFPTLHEMGVDHPGAGDIFAFAKPGWHEGQGPNPLPGNHGHPISQHSTLFVTGGHPALDEAPEKVPGQTVYDPDNHAFLPPAEGPGNLSIAPTVAALFGIGEPEGGYDGQPLTEAFDPWALTPHVPCGAANPPPSVSIDDVALSEGNSGQRNATFTVSLSAPSLSEIRVDYRTNDAGATAPDDYETRGPSTLSFDPGDTEKQITVPVKGDTLDEPNENFTVDLSAPVNAELAKLRGTATILDDDGPPDTDGDLVPDGLDSCPTTAGPAANSGCPQTPAAAGAPESCRTETLGTAANDTLTGTAGPDLFRGLLGADRLSGLDGPDCLFGGRGNDTLTGEGGNDLLRGGDGRDRVSGGPEPDVISGGRGLDRLSGGAGDDQIRAADNGRDRVRCGPGHDEVIANHADVVAGSCEVVGRAG